MEFLYQIHNVGIYLEESSSAWNIRIKENIKVQFDGFEIYKGIQDIKYKLIIKDIEELDKRNDAIVVPECSYSYSDGTIRSEYLKIGYKIEDFQIIMWTGNETWYAPYLLEVLFEKQGITFVHGCSVAVDNSAGKLALAFGGIGKTCFIANAAKKDRVKILGDDLILVSREGKLYSYPRPFCLYEYHKVLFPQFFKEHKVKYVHIKPNMYFRRGVRKLKKILKINDKNVYEFLPVSPTKLFPSKKIQVHAVDLEDIYILRRNQAVEEVEQIRMDSVESVTNFAMNVILHEWDIGFKVILNHYAQNFESIQKYINPRHEILQEAFGYAKNIKCIEIPEKMSATNVSLALNNIILEGIK